MYRDTHATEYFCFCCDHICAHVRERHDQGVSTHASYSGRPWFESRPSNWISWQRCFVFFLSSSGKC